MKLYLRLLKYLRPHLRTLIPALIFMFLFAGLSGLTLTMIIPLANIVLGPAADSGSISDSGSAPSTDWMVFLPDFAKAKVTSWLHGTDRLRNLGNLCLFILAVFFLKNIFEYLERYLSAVVEQASMQDIRNRLYQHY